MSTVPMLDLRDEIEQQWPGYAGAFERVMRSGTFIGGEEVEAFEAELAASLGVAHAIGVNSGTDALTIGLRALGVGEGDEVITTAFTFVATGSSILLAGAKPVFADIDPTTYDLDPDCVARKIGPRTKAILPVHLYGQPAPMAALVELAERHGLVVLEDAAQALGASVGGRPVGRLGHAAALSFFPSKNLGAFGDGGALVTSDPEVARVARMLRAHGAARKYHNEILGYNSRLDALQAAMLRVKLPRLQTAVEGRRRAAARYDELLARAPNVTVPARRPDCEHSFHQYTIRILDGSRDRVQEKLASRGIASMVYYPRPLHRLPMMPHSGEPLPHTERAVDEVLSLPIWPTLGPDAQRLVVDALLSD
jgi:dTDP-4-amino-4,6-dideoxygalactose transaminase